MRRGREIRRASESQREGKKKEEPKGVGRWSKALARLAVLGLSFMPPGSTSESGPPMENISHEMVQDSEDIAENNQVEEEMVVSEVEETPAVRGGQEVPVEEVANEKMSLSEFHAEVLDELVGEIDQLIQRKLGADWRVPQGAKDRFETLTVVGGEDGHIAIEMEGQPIVDLVVTTYEQYQQYLEDSSKMAAAESDSEARIWGEVLKDTQRRDAENGYNDLNPDAPFYYIKSLTDVYTSDVRAGRLDDGNDRDWLVRNVLSLSSMNAKH